MSCAGGEGPGEAWRTVFLPREPTRGSAQAAELGLGNLRLRKPFVLWKTPGFKYLVLERKRKAVLSLVFVPRTSGHKAP